MLLLKLNFSSSENDRSFSERATELCGRNVDFIPSEELDCKAARSLLVEPIDLIVSLSFLRSSQNVDPQATKNYLLGCLSFMSAVLMKDRPHKDVIRFSLIYESVVVLSGLMDDRVLAKTINRSDELSDKLLSSDDDVMKVRGFD